MNNYIEVKIRKDTGTRSSNRLRRKKLIPAVIYSKGMSVSIFLDEKEAINIYKYLANNIRLIKLKIKDSIFDVLIKSYNLHPVSNNILHFDFQKVEDNNIVNVKVPFNIIGKELSHGIRHGGVLVKHLNSISVKTKIKDMPKFLDIDISKLKINSSLYVKDIIFPSCFDIPVLLKKDFLKQPVVSISGTRTSITEDKNEKN